MGTGSPLKPVNIMVPTINTNPWNHDDLFGIWNLLNADFLDVTFDFSKCLFIQQNGVAFLGGLANLVEYRSGKVNFKWDTLLGSIKTNLGQNGFCANFGLGVSPWPGHSIPYRHDTILEESSITNYLKTNWLGRGWVNLSQELSDAITSRVLECYLNCFEHSESPIGVFSCGQHFPRLETLKICIVDFGIGIPANVRKFKNNPNIETTSALEWAFQSGTTTKPDGIGRGLGLDLLKQFITINQGYMEIYSGDGRVVYASDREEYSQQSSFFEGTLINITLQCNEVLYTLATEVAPEYF